MESFAPATDPRAFRAALGRFATGVTVVTARDGGGMAVGLTANSFASVSLDPPLVLWSLARASRRYAALSGAEAFAIHVLGLEQQPLCDAFARGGEGFDAAPWEDGPEGVPLLPGCLARFRCRRHATVEGGDHVVVLGWVEQVEARSGSPLLFQGGRYGGFAPAAEGHPSPEP